MAAVVLTFCEMDDAHAPPIPPNASSPSQTNVTAASFKDDALHPKSQRKRGRTEQDTELRKEQKSKFVKRTFRTKSKPTMKKNA